MRRRDGVDDNRKFSYSVWGGLALLLLLATASFRVADAQSEAVPAETRKETQPFIVSREKIADAGKKDPRVRFELRVGEAREHCTAWRFETLAQSDGRAIFELKEPADKKVLLETDFSPRHLELVLGDANCNYRIRIERNK